MNPNLSSDFRDELYVASMRCLAIVVHLAYTSKQENILTFERAVIFNACLKNPRVAERVLVELNPKRAPGRDAPAILYPDEAEYGGTFDKPILLRIAISLASRNLINIQRRDGDFYLTPTQAGIEATANTPIAWVQLLDALKTVAGKPLSVLQKSALRGA